MHFVGCLESKCMFNVLPFTTLERQIMTTLLKQDTTCEGSVFHSVIPVLALIRLRCISSFFFIGMLSAMSCNDLTLCDSFFSSIALLLSRPGYRKDTGGDGVKDASELH